jgi:hypothetical protein
MADPLDLDEMPGLRAANAFYTQRIKAAETRITALEAERAEMLRVVRAVANLPDGDESPRCQFCIVWPHEPHDEVCAKSVARRIVAAQGKEG